jgi:hypothetical protein
MPLETQLTDLDLEDAIAYKFFIDNLPLVMEDSLTDPDITQEKLEEIKEAITLLAGLAYRISNIFMSMRIANKSNNDRIESD